jgi:hypothetical protein
MIQTLVRNWWLLVLCGVFNALHSLANLLMLDREGSWTFRKFAPLDEVRIMGALALLAGVCAIAAGVWHSAKGRLWLLALNGAALCAFGAICISPLPSSGSLSFRPVSLLFVVMALSVGILALEGVRRLRRHIPDRWLLSVAGIASVGFAIGFLALGQRWFRFEQPGGFFVWMSAYFGFAAICMLALGLRLKGLRAAFPRLSEDALSAG